LQLIKNVQNDNHWLNTICPYYTMFPLAYPLAELAALQAPARILDPFCGRGTTLYAARMLKLEAYGTDTNPVAVAIAEAKLARTTPEQVMRLAMELLAGDEVDMPEGDFWFMAYAPSTLQAICKLRIGLRRRWSNAAKLLRALVLGILHGPIRQGEPSYLSNQMPRTFASKPDYSVRYWRTHKLETPPIVDVLDVIRRKTIRVLAEVPPPVVGKVRCADARQLPFTGPFDAVVTSPPYYGMNTYRADQWLRYWFLGGPPSVPYADVTQVSRGGIEGFTQSLADVWGAVGRVSRTETRLCVRFGALPSEPIDPEAVFRESLRLSGQPWRVTQIRQVPPLARKTRQSVQMGARGQQNAAETEIDITAVLVD
jgi:predicted RNA methylase